MKAIVLREKEELSVEQRTAPSPKIGEVVIEVKATGICGTDLHIFHGGTGSTSVSYPIILGHELSGIVIEIGEGVTSLQVGDRVSIDPNIYCGECRFCREGRIQLCDRLQAVGVTRNGGMAEQCAVPAANCHLIPNGMSFEEAALVEPLGCVLHGVERLKLRSGASALVVGGGFIGLLMIQVLKLYGVSPIVVSEPDAAKRERAIEFGASAAMSPREVASSKAWVSLGVCDGFDIVAECVGRQESMEQAVHSSAKGGQVLLFGVAAPGISIPLYPYEMFAKELSVLGSFINPHTHSQAISLIAQKRVNVSSLVTQRFTPEEVPDAMAAYGSLSVIKSLIVY
ncbi:zinc-dependent alcohol dehydrogenase family protein [Paenibacillus sp. UNC451MF]|uniref:zinc-dependent alcohol dehydrogenase family protein n=1 Tax=Paenibacillus sp. UNC451MF TaxID=1449063 RepID=UPI00048AAABC|nr:zinc-dependent alcohol dehydrogenase family protein [Paenibacillus sp. UNC451MF]